MVKMLIEIAQEHGVKLKNMENQQRLSCNSYRPPRHLLETRNAIEACTWEIGNPSTVMFRLNYCSETLTVKQKYRPTKPRVAYSSVWVKRILKS